MHACTLHLFCVAEVESEISTTYFEYDMYTQPVCICMHPSPVLCGPKGERIKGGEYKQLDICPCQHASPQLHIVCQAQQVVQCFT